VPGTGQHLDCRAGNGAVLGGGRRAPPEVVLAEDHQQRLAEGRQPLRECLLLQVRTDCLGCRGVHAEAHAARLVHERLGDRVARAERLAQELAELLVGQIRQPRRPDGGLVRDVGGHPGAGVDERERGHQARPLFGESGGDRPAAGVADDDGAGDAEPVQCRADPASLVGDCVARIVRSGRLAAPEQVDADDAVGSGQ
jgi:hypothetical protein